MIKKIYTISGKQYHVFKYNDRYYYKNPNGPVYYIDPLEYYRFR